MIIKKIIQGYEGIYTIDKKGNIYSANGKIRKTTIDYRGYERIILNKNNVRKTYSVHRLVAITFIKNTLNKPDVNHKDANKINNHVDNLEWVTKSENCRHAVKLGLIGCWNSNKNGKLSGEGNGRCKISDNELRCIRKNFKGIRGEPIKLAQKYNVDPQTMRKLLNNKYRVMQI